jgi:glycosyltransferase involved in cell wall biosynthesis
MIYQTFQLLQELRELVALDPNAIHLIGKVNNDDLQHWYNSADFIISSSHYEAGGVAVCEGLSCGCIPILTDIPSFRMMTDDGRMGFLYKVGDDIELLNSLKRSLELERNEMRKLVLKQFEQKLSFEANAKCIMEVIHTL